MRGHPAVLFILSLLLFAAGSWSLPLMDRDEPRFAEAAREMRQGGDYVIPYFNHEYRFDKPPLTYWLQIPAYSVLGENEFAARLPSIICGALTVVVIWGFGQRLCPETGVGGLAALLFMTCVQVFMHARGAVADMIMVLFVALSTWAAWELLRDEEPRRNWRWWTVFWVSMALGFLGKGPVAWLPLGAIWIYAALRKPAGLGKRFGFLPGTVLMLVLVGLWGVPALVKTHGLYFSIGIGKHVVGRSLTSMEGHGATGWLTYLLLLPFFFLTVFVSFFPWSIRIPWLIKRLRAQGNQMSGETLFLLLSAALYFGVFTLVRTKLPHYTLPAFPMLALLMARELEQAGAQSSFRRWVVVAAVVEAIVALFVFPSLSFLFPSKALVAKSALDLKPDMVFAAGSYQEPSLVWYARKYVRGFMTPSHDKKLQRFMEEPGPRFCVAPAGTIQPQPGWKVFTQNGFNIPQGKKVDLELVVKPD